MARLDGAFVVASNNEVAFRVAGYDPKRALVIDPVLSYSTYLGGSGDDCGHTVSPWTRPATPTSRASLTSTDFPTVNPLQGTSHSSGGYGDAFVAKLNAAGSALVYSTYLGGSGDDYGQRHRRGRVRQRLRHGLHLLDRFPHRQPAPAAIYGGCKTATPLWPS